MTNPAARHIYRKEHSDVTSAPIVLSGVTSFTRNGEVELIHHAAITISSDRVEIQVDGCGPGCACYPPLVSTDPDTVRFFHALDARFRDTQWKAAP